MNRIEQFERGLQPFGNLEHPQADLHLADRMHDYGVSAVSIALIHKGELAWMRGCANTTAYQGTVFIGIKTITQLPIGAEEGPIGTTILAGWNPELPPDKSFDYLYIRGR